MKCQKHVPDSTSDIGVCATCLRERLQVILAAQTQAQAQTEDEDEDQPAEALASSDHSNNQSEKNADEKKNPPPINANDFVGRKDNDNDKVIYSTPQVGPPFSVTATECDGKTPKRKFGRFWNPTSLFRTKSNVTENSNRELTTTYRSWMSMIFHDRRKNNGGGASNFRQSDRESEGFSSEIDGHGRSSSTESRISRETSPKSRNQAAPAPARQSRSLQAGKRVFNWRLCLSPMVRANSNQHLVHNHKGTLQESGASVGGGAQKIRFISAASFSCSRSKKLAHFGRFDFKQQEYVHFLLTKRRSFKNTAWQGNSQTESKVQTK
ncbi:hypothetical protein S245_038943 [Arachis hypogaea]